MIYTVDKGTEGIQEVLIVSPRDYRLSGYIRVRECKLVNLLTLVNYLVRVEYELVDDTEIIVNLTVKAQYKERTSTIRVIENDLLNILNLVRLPEDAIPFVTALLLDNNNEDCDELINNLLSAYVYAINNGDQPVGSGLVGVIIKLLSAYVYGVKECEQPELCDFIGLINNLLSVYVYTVNDGDQPKVRDLVGLQIILTVLNQAKQDLAELDKAIAEIVIRMI